MKRLFSLLTAALLAGGTLAACGASNVMDLTSMYTRWVTAPSGVAFVFDHGVGSDTTTFRVTTLNDGTVVGRWTAPSGAYLNPYALFGDRLLVGAAADGGEGAIDYFVIDRTGKATTIEATSAAEQEVLDAISVDFRPEYELGFAGGVIRQSVKPSTNLPEYYLLNPDLSVRAIEVGTAPFGAYFFVAGDSLYAVVPQLDATVTDPELDAFGDPIEDPNETGGALIRFDRDLQPLWTAKLPKGVNYSGGRGLVLGDQLFAYFGGSTCPKAPVVCADDQGVLLSAVYDLATGERRGHGFDASMAGVDTLIQHPRQADQYLATTFRNSSDPDLRAAGIEIGGPGGSSSLSAYGTDSMRLFVVGTDIYLLTLYGEISEQSATLEKVTGTIDLAAVEPDPFMSGSYLEACVAGDALFTLTSNGNLFRINDGEAVRIEGPTWPDYLNCVGASAWVGTQQDAGGYRFTPVVMKP